LVQENRETVQEKRDLVQENTEPVQENKDSVPGNRLLRKESGGLVLEEAEIQARKADGLVRIFSVVSGKGGVGKTNVSVNLAIALARMGKRVLLLDADIGMTNADIVMGIHYAYDLFDYLEGRATLQDIITEGPEGVKVISGGAGLLTLEKLDEKAQKDFVNGLIDLGGFEVMVIDNGAGISRETLSFITFAHEVILVTTPEPTAITDAYRVLKTISFYGLKPSVKLVVNRVTSLDAGNEAFRKLYATSREFLTVELENCGYIFDDARVGKAVMQQQPVVLSYPNALSSANIGDIALRIMDEAKDIRNVSTLKQLGNRFLKFFGT
jgi:flagellar biosynthesis protein FlhG